MARRNGSRAGGDRPNGGRPKGSNNETIIAYRDAYIRAVCRQALRAWEAERAGAKKNGERFDRPRPKPNDQEGAIEYLSHVTFVAIAKALQTGQPSAAIQGIQSIENRMLGKVRQEMMVGGLPDAPPLTQPPANAAPIELVFTLGDEPAGS